MSGRNHSRSFRCLFIGAILLLLLLSLLALGTGRYRVSPVNVVKVLLSKVLPIHPALPPNAESVVLILRIPRILGAVLIGGALSLSGATYQGVFQNPLVSPDLLGVSAGASVGAAAAILLHTESWWVQAFAFTGGIAAVGLTNLIPRLVKNRSKMMLVLAGVIISGLMSSLLGILLYIADPNSELPEITYWQLGSLQKVGPGNIRVVIPVILAAATVLMFIRWRINVLAMGDMEAKTLGVSTTRLRLVTIICSTLLTAASVCICGNVGWIGLVVPHFSRLLAGPDHGKLLPMSFVCGGIFMLLIDTLARTVVATELPLSILTGLIGAPFYLFLLKKQGMNIS